MSPLIETILVALAVLAAAAYFVVPLLRRGKAGKACGSGCCTPRKPLDDRRST